MALQDLLDLSSAKGAKKIGLSEERVMAQIPELTKAFLFGVNIQTYL